MRPEDPDPQAAAVPPMPPVPDPGTSDVTPARSSHRRTLVVAGALIGVLLAAGGAAAFVAMRGAGEKLLDHVPATTDAVAIAYLDPGAGQKVNLLRIAHRFPQLGSSQQLHDNVNRALDSTLGAVGLDHSDLAWVGPEIGVALDVPNLQGPTVSVLISTTDPSASQATLQKLRARSGGDWTSESYDGVPVWTAEDGGTGGPSAQAVVDGVVVIGNSRSMVDGIVDASHGKVPQLQDDPNFTATMADLPASNLGFIYVDAARLVDILKRQPGFQALSTSTDPDPTLEGLDAVQGFAVSLSAQPDGLALDATEHYDASKLTVARAAQLNAPSHPNPLLTAVPQDAWAVASVEHVDQTIGSALAQARQTSPQLDRVLDASGVSDLLRAIGGDLAVEGRSGGASPTPGGALLLGASNDAQTQAALDRLATFVAHKVHLTWTRSVYQGISINRLATGDEDGPFTPAYAVVGHAAVVATSMDEMQQIIDTEQGGANITSSPAFVEARKEVPAGSVFFIDVQAVVTDVRATMPADQRARFDAAAGAGLRHVAYVVSGSASTSESSRTRLFIRIT
jgi:hypothetical protein